VGILGDTRGGQAILMKPGPARQRVAVRREVHTNAARKASSSAHTFHHTFEGDRLMLDIETNAPALQLRRFLARVDEEEHAPTTSVAA
jgi:hypothetical protein